MSPESRRVCIVGAGFIADFHAAALARVPGVELVAAVDADRRRAERAAKRWGGGTRVAAYGGVDELLAAGGGVDAAHVAVPPDRHREVAEPLLAAGVHVLLEKPMAEAAADALALVGAAERAGVRLAVNLNQLYHPAYVRFRRRLRAGEFGPLRHVIAVLSVPLRQLDARQLGHWMFRAPQNIVLEQGVHPLSQVLELAGPLLEAQTTVSEAERPAPDVAFHRTWAASLRCERATAQLFMAFGQSLATVELVALCDDALVGVDLVGNRVLARGKTRWLDPLDRLHVGQGLAGSALAQSWRNFVADGLAMVRLGPPSDPFAASIDASVRAFHGWLGGAAEIVNDGRFGAAVVGAAERIAAPVWRAPAAEPALRTATGTEPLPPADVLVIGGTGFIGRHLVARLLERGRTVRVLARTTRGLPEALGRPGVRVVRGDVARPEDVERAVAGAAKVVNLAHGGGGGLSDAEVIEAIVGGARAVAEACLRQGALRLVHAGSIAALYLGDPEERVTGATPVDPRAAERPAYARAKAAADGLLLELHRTRGLPVCILRPGVVVGEGGTAFHGGLGMFNRDRHCLGWNRGDNPLPFVLVEDVAEAFALALDAPSSVEGCCYNLVGEVAMSARAYIEELGRALERPLRFHPSQPALLQAEEVGKWVVKRLAGRRDAPFPSYRDLRSRGLVARFDTGDAKRDLGWRPEADRDAFVRRAIAVHRR